MTDHKSRAGIDIIAAAVGLAMWIHHDQDRKADEDSTELVPYTAHLLGTAAVIIESPLATAEHVAAAMLHDSVEDRPERLFGHGPDWTAGPVGVEAELARHLSGTFHDDAVATRVATLIMSATENRSEPKPVREDYGSAEEFLAARVDDWKSRKAEYRRILRREDVDSALVSLADNVYNVRSLVDDFMQADNDDLARAIDSRFTVHTQLRVEHYRAIVAITHEQGWNDVLVRHLAGAVKELSRVAADLTLFDPSVSELHV